MKRLLLGLSAIGFLLATFSVAFSQESVPTDSSKRINTKNGKFVNLTVPGSSYVQSGFVPGEKIKLKASTPVLLVVLRDNKGVAQLTDSYFKDGLVCPKDTLVILSKNRWTWSAPTDPTYNKVWGQTDQGVVVVFSNDNFTHKPSNEVIPGFPNVSKETEGNDDAPLTIINTTATRKLSVQIKLVGRSRYILENTLVEHFEGLESELFPGMRINQAPEQADYRLEIRNLVISKKSERSRNLNSNRAINDSIRDSISYGQSQAYRINNPYIRIPIIIGSRAGGNIVRSKINLPVRSQEKFAIISMDLVLINVRTGEEVYQTKSHSFNEVVNWYDNGNQEIGTKNPELFQEIFEAKLYPQASLPDEQIEILVVATKALLQLNQRKEGK